MIMVISCLIQDNFYSPVFVTKHEDAVINNNEALIFCDF